MLAFIAVIGFWSTHALATPIDNYRFDIVFNCVLQSGGDPCKDDVGGIKPGTLYSGFLGISSDVLATTNGFVNGGVESFYFALGDTVWDSSRPCNGPSGSDYCGSRGVNGFGSPFTLDIQNGQLLGICCSAFGSADFPFVDLVSDVFPQSGGSNVATVTGFYRDFQVCPGNPGGCRLAVEGRGTFSLTHVPEPPTLALFGFGLGALAFVWRRRSAVARR